VSGIRFKKIGGMDWRRDRARMELPTLRTLDTNIIAGIEVEYGRR
jgi:hypothetical protein